MSLTKDLTKQFKLFATLMQLDGANSFKIIAYDKAVRALQESDLDLEQHLEDKTLTSIDGIGKGIAEKIQEFASSGKMVELEELQQKYPPGLLQMTEIQGFGAKKAKAVFEQLDVSTLEELKAACEDGTVAALKGFGKKTAEKILQGMAQLEKHSGRYRLDIAWKAARPLLKLLQENEHATQVELAGSIRRFKETVKDLDFVVATDEPKKVIEAFTQFEDVERVTGAGDTKASVILDSGISADLRCVTAKQFPFTLQHFSGSKEHNTKLRALAKDKGLKSNEYGIFPDGKDESLPAESEADVYKALGLSFIVPEMREDLGEIEAAEKGDLPKLIETDDLRGVLHMHTTYSDGRPEVEDYAKWSLENGNKWMGISDHSQTASYAGGLKPEDVKRQWREIDKVNEQYKSKGVRLLKGIESDILRDGSLDYEEDLLKQFDFIVASVHSQFTLNSDDQTRRLINAVENPYTTILGHMTGRLLLKRDGYEFRQKDVIKAAGENGVIIEINCSPHRLDLDWRLIRFAVEHGVMLCLSPDAHAIEGLDDLFYGIGIARKGWLTKDHIVNCLSADEFLKLAAKRRP